MQNRSELPSGQLTLRDGLPDRPTLVFLHGVYHGSWAFEKFSQPFSKAGYRIAMVDLPGHGGETRLHAQSDLGYSDLVHECNRMIDRIPGTKVIVGHSLGGLLALSLQPRSDVVGTVLLATPLPEAIRSKQWKLLFEFPRQAMGFLLTGNPNWLYHHEPFTDRYFFSPHTPTDEKELANRRIQDLHEPRKLFKEILAMRFERLINPKPALIILGSEDPTVTSAVGRQLKAITGGEVIVIERSGHDIMLENNAHLAVEAMLRWLRRVEADG